MKWFTELAIEGQVLLTVVCIGFLIFLGVSVDTANETNRIYELSKNPEALRIYLGSKYGK